MKDSESDHIIQQILMCFSYNGAQHTESFILKWIEPKCCDALNLMAVARYLCGYRLSLQLARFVPFSTANLKYVSLLLSPIARPKSKLRPMCTWGFLLNIWHGSTKFHRKSLNERENTNKKSSLSSVTLLALEMCRWPKLDCLHIAVMKEQHTIE